MSKRKLNNMVTDQGNVHNILGEKFYKTVCKYEPIFIKIHVFSSKRTGVIYQVIYTDYFNKVG